MSGLSERQRELLRFSVTRRFPDQRALSAAVLNDLGITLRVYNAELARALAHPDGFPFVHEAIGEETQARSMPQEFLDVLLFEAQWRPDGGSKGEAIRARFGFSTTTYRTRLEAAMKHEAAARIAPAVVRINSVGARPAPRPDENQSWAPPARFERAT